MESSPPPIPQSLAGTKRPSTTTYPPYPSSSASFSASPNTLLPPFHPLSSSPGLPRPFKRVARHDNAPQDGKTPATASSSAATTTPARTVSAALKYPTPLPTSSTHILTSSPPNHNSATTTTVTATATATATATITANNANDDVNATVTDQIHPPAIAQRKRGPLTRTESTASERTPLSPVPCISLPPTGKTVSIGRSSLSCDFQLPPSNRSISRVHVQAAYVAGDGDGGESDRVEVKCTGWNGITLYVQDQSYDLAKGMTFASDIKGVDVMLDVQGSRVLLQWPREVREVTPYTETNDLEDLDEEGDVIGEEDDGAPSSSQELPLGLTTSPLNNKMSNAKRSLMDLPPSSPMLLPATTATTPASASASRGDGDGGGGDCDGDDNGSQSHGTTRDATTNPTDANTAGQSFLTPSSPVVVYEDHEHERTSPARHSTRREEDEEDDQENIDARVHRAPTSSQQTYSTTRTHTATATTADARDAAAAFTLAETNASSDYEPDELSELDDDDYDDEIELYDEEDEEDEDEKSRHRNSTTTRQNEGGNGNRSKARSRSPGSHKRSDSGTSHTSSRAAQRSRRNTSTTRARTASRSKTRNSAAAKHDPDYQDHDNYSDDQEEREEEEKRDILETITPATIDAIRNHAINQLAFSRLNSAPLSTILNHLPPEYRISLAQQNAQHHQHHTSATPGSPTTSSDPTSTATTTTTTTTTTTSTKAEKTEKGKPTRQQIKHIIETTPCIGVVNREGKDAAGKPLESEYYYIPDADGDEVRSLAVTRELMKPGLRSCRKQHKQYYWKKPK